MIVRGCISILITVLPSCLLAETKEFSKREAIDLLYQIAAANEANYSALQTWKGEYYRQTKNPNYRLASLGPADRSSMEKLSDEIGSAIVGAKVAFAIDFQTDRVLIQEEEVDTAVFDSSGNRMEVPEWRAELGLFDQPQHIIRDGQVYSTLAESVRRAMSPFFRDPYDNSTNSAHRVFTRQALDIDTHRQHQAARQDPRRLFMITRTYYAWDYLRGWARVAEDDGVADDRWSLQLVSEGGSPKAYELMKIYTTQKMSYGPPGKVIERFDATNFLPIESTYFKGRVASGPQQFKDIVSYRSWRYKKYNKVWIPQESKEILYDVQTFEPLVDVHHHLVRCVVNKRLSSDQFEITALGGEVGDRLIDKEANELYLLSTRGLVPAFSASQPPAVPTKSRWMPTLRTISIFAVLFTAFTIFLWSSLGKGKEQ